MSKKNKNKQKQQNQISGQTKPAVEKSPQRLALEKQCNELNVKIKKPDWKKKNVIWI